MTDFGKKFSRKKLELEENLLINIQVFVPESVKNDKSISLMFNFNKSTIKDFSKKDEFKFNWNTIDPDITIFSRNITPPKPLYKNAPWFDIRLQRSLSKEEINQVKQDFMPGFMVSWNYNQHLDDWNKYKPDDINKEFRR